MFRTFLSYFVLIFIPVVSLVIAIVPYVWVKRRSARLSPKEQALFPEKEYRLANTVDSGFRPVPLSWVWGAFVVGLVGNVGWSLLILKLSNDKISIYLFGTDGSGAVLGLLIYSLFIIFTSFIFHKIKYGKFSTKSIIYNIIISLLTVGLVLGVWIVLFFIGYRQLFYQLN